MAIMRFGNTAVDLCGNDFLRPYLKRALHVDDDDIAPHLTSCIRVATAETSHQADSALEQIGAMQEIPLLELHCPYVVGTGMTGLLRRIASGIYRGSYVHIAGNEARISVVHATDVARVAAAAAGAEGKYLLTDGSNPSIHDLSDAFAIRIADKRIITIKPRWARLWYGREYFSILTSDHLINRHEAEDIKALLPDFEPVNVVNYLSTHVYSEQDI